MARQVVQVVQKCEEALESQHLGVKRKYKMVTN